MENIIVVGAGLVGSLLSIYLTRAGFKVSIYERSIDPRQHIKKKQVALSILPYVNEDLERLMM